MTVKRSDVIFARCSPDPNPNRPTSPSCSPGTPTTSSSTRCAPLLPPPITDTPEDLARRDNAAIAQVASLLPANADEATLAAQYVAAHAQAVDCLRLARKCERDGASSSNAPLRPPA